MAYGNWSASTWVQVWNNGYYKIEVEWSYKQDPENLKTTYRTTRLRCTSLTQYHSFYGTGNVIAGIGTNTSGSPIGGQSMTVNAGSSAILDLQDVSEEFSHNSDGSISTIYKVYGYLDAGNGGQYYSPTGGWQAVAVSIPKITPVMSL